MALGSSRNGVPREDAPLQLDRFETNLLAHRLGLVDDPRRVERGLLAGRRPAGGLGVGGKA